MISPSRTFVFATENGNEDTVWLHSCVSFEVIQPQWEKLKDVYRDEQGWFQLHHSLAGADNNTSPAQVLFAINHTDTGEDKPPVFATPRKKRTVKEEGFVLIPKVDSIPEEADDDFESGIGDVAASLRKLHKLTVNNSGRIILQEADLVQLKNQVGLSCPRLIQNQVIEVNEEVESLSAKLETLKVFNGIKNEDTVKFLSDLSSRSNNRIDIFVKRLWDAFFPPIKQYLKPFSGFFNDWTTAASSGAQLKPGDILQSKIVYLTNQINVLNTKIAVAGGIAGSASGTTQAPPTIFGRNVGATSTNHQGGFSFGNLSAGAAFGGQQQTTASSGPVNQHANPTDLKTRVQDLEAEISAMKNLFSTLASNQGNTDQLLQDLSSEVSGGSTVEIGLSRLKNMRDCETEVEKLDKIPNSFVDLPPPDSFTGIQDFFSAMQLANLKPLLEKERIDMDRNLKAAKFLNKNAALW